MRNLAIAYILATCVFVPWYNYEHEPIQSKLRVADGTFACDCGWRMYYKWDDPINLIISDPR